MAKYNSNGSLRFSYAILFWLAIWGVLNYSAIISTSLVPSPTQVISKMLSREFLFGYVLSSLPSTFAWVLSSWGLGLFCSFLLSLLPLRMHMISSALDVLFVSGRTLPSVIAIPLFAAIMGSGRLTAAACTVFMVICYSESSFLESHQGLKRTRAAIKETTKLSWQQEIIIIVLPGAMHAWRAIALQSFGIALVVTVAGEMLLSFQNSVGNDVADMIWLMRMADLYAMVAWLIVLALIIKRATHFIPELFKIPAKHIVNDQCRKL